MSSLHRIHWKGRTSGPYSREEIRAKLAAGEFSLLHRVEAAGRRIPIDEFLSGDAAPRSDYDRMSSPAEEAVAPILTIHAPMKRPMSHNPFPDNSRHTNVAYFLCGLCFVLPLFATVAAGWWAWETRHAGDTGRANTLFSLATLFTLLGLVFWGAVVFAWSRGVI